MDQYHHEISAYVACGNTQRLADAIIRLCEAEGMRQVAPKPLSVALEAPALQSNHWSIAVIPGVSGWHLLLGYPETLFCERGHVNGETRLIALCESLGVAGLLREVHDGFGGPEVYGRVTLETDGRGQQALSGHMWCGDQEAQEQGWYGMSLSAEARTADVQLIATQLPEIIGSQPNEWRTDLDGARICGAYAYRLTGPITCRWWSPESAWRWLVEALRLGGPMPVEDGLILSFEWPAGDRLDPPRSSAPPHANPDWSRFRYGDGHQVQIGDLVRDEEGAVIRVTDLISTAGPDGPVPGGILVRYPSGNALIHTSRVAGLRLAERLRLAPTPPPTVSLQPLAEQGDRDAMHLLALCYEKGDRVPKNRLLAVALHRRAAELGHASSQFAWGQALCEGDAAPCDWDLGTRWIRQAAENGSIDAQFVMAQRYSVGIGVARDRAQFVYWLEKAAALGDESAQFELATIYFGGDKEVPRDLPRAIHWLALVAQRGNHKAQYFLGLSYERGEGLPQDYVKAVHWYRKAAEQGSRQAQCNLADKYEHGLGVEKDEAQAALWYRKSAEQGVAPAQYSLGLLYHEGRGVSLDSEQARYWLQQAAAAGYEDARSALRRLDAP